MTAPHLLPDGYSITLRRGDQEILLVALAACCKPGGAGELIVHAHFPPAPPVQPQHRVRSVTFSRNRAGVWTADGEALSRTVPAALAAWLDATYAVARARITRARSTGTPPDHDTTDTAMTEYTDPAVFTTGVADGWADVETDPARIDWPARQAEALIPFHIIDGRPVSPGPPAPVQRGRAGLGRWGENPMADALITATTSDGRHLLLVERDDGHGWAVPGGAIEPGETPVAAAARELREETGLTVPRHLWRVGEPQFVPDPRGSDEAWAVTVVARADLGQVARLPAVVGGDDARRAAWIPAGSYTELAAVLARVYAGEVFPAHADLLAAEFPDTDDRR